MIVYIYQSKMDWATHYNGPFQSVRVQMKYVRFSMLLRVYGKVVMYWSNTEFNKMIKEIKWRKKYVEKKVRKKSKKEKKSELALMNCFAIAALSWTP